METKKQRNTKEVKRFNLGFLVGLFIVAFSGVIVYLFSSTIHNMIDEKRKNDRMHFVKDSLETEFIKKQIDSFYIFEHSEIKSTK